MAGKFSHDNLILTLAGILKDRRETLGLSQREVALMSGLNRSYICDLEQGARNVSVRNLSRLAYALKVKPSRLLRLAEDDTGWATNGGGKR